MPRHLAARRIPVIAEAGLDRRRRNLPRIDDAHRRRLAPLPGRPTPVVDEVEETFWDEARLLDPDFDAPDGTDLDRFRGLARHVGEWDTD